MKISRLLSLALASALALSSVGCSGASDDSQKTVKIGFAAPLTGDNALYGEGMKRAVQLAIDEAKPAFDLLARLQAEKIEPGGTALRAAQEWKAAGG